MDPNLYKAAIEGHIDAFKDYANPLNLLLTPNKNTILHIHLSSSSERSIAFVKEVLVMCPVLLLQVNDVNGDAPLHIAARHGHSNVVKVLIEKAKAQHQEDLEGGLGATKQMLRTTNKRNETALHEAARNKHLDVLKVLTQEDPDFPHSANDRGETPLYIAALNGWLNGVIEMLETCTSPAHCGPGGKTALHAAIMAPEGMATAHKLLHKWSSLAKEADESGWTPLHYAVDRYKDLRSSIMVEGLLEYDVTAAYVGNKDRKMTPLHLAACDGKVKTMEKIISKSPDCCELVDTKGWNVSHYAAISGSEEALKVIVKNSPFLYHLDMKDANGNTPFHLLAALGRHCPSFLRPMCHPLVPNYQNMNYFDILYPTPENKNKISEWLNDVGSGPAGEFRTEEGQLVNCGNRVMTKFEKAKGSHLVVAALIATVTFTAAFTLPGGYRSDQGDHNRGSAILSKHTAFQAFVIANAIAMLLSTSSLFIHFHLEMVEYRGKYIGLMTTATYFIMLAMGAMMVAFVTGTYAVLAPSLGLAIPTCFIGLTFFIFVLLILRKTVKIGPQRFRGFAFELLSSLTDLFT